MPARDPVRVTTRYKPDHRSFGKFLLSDSVHDLAMKVAREGMAMAIGFSPRSTDNRSDRTGHYAEQFNVEGYVAVMKNGVPRRAARIINDSPYAAPVEWGGDWEREKQGGRHGRAKRPLGRTGAVLGGLYGNHRGHAG